MKVYSHAFTKISENTQFAGFSHIPITLQKKKKSCVLYVATAKQVWLSENLL